ncbi:MAG: transglycosylase domain-containing protein, partial [Myxococcales bacterium]|nr:transglycosylase domain-containing protein [Myxococcales bacterium]
STITQQVVKNVLLSPERTFERKAREVLLARRIEQDLSKDEILELYLNHIYFGHGRYGVEEASRYYFGKGVSDLDLAEAALIAGLAKGPNIYSPRVDEARAMRRRNLVLTQMAQKGFASRRAVEEALKAPIVLAPAVETMPTLAPEAVAEAKRVLAEVVGDKARLGGYTVTTTIDPALQAAGRKAIRENLDAYLARHGWVAPLRKPKKGGLPPYRGKPDKPGHHVYHAEVIGHDDAGHALKIRVGDVEGTVSVESARYNPKRLEASRFAELGVVLRVSPIREGPKDPAGLPLRYRLELGPQSALVAIDPRTRQIVALVGGYEAVVGGLDRASRAKRQPGSTFKPIVYSYGIHKRAFTPASIVPGVKGRTPPPAKKGEPPPEAPPLRVREAVARSVNPAAEWALETVGAEGVVAWAKELGVESHLEPTKSLALGAYEMRPRELANVYATFAAGGIHEGATLISEIRGPDGAVIALPPQAARRRVLDDSEAFVVTSLLTSVISGGTGQRAKSLGLPIAGKTGTSNEAKDAWFAGYSPEMTCVVWTGFDDAVPLGRAEQGATAALPAWIDFMKAAHAGHAVTPWPEPPGVVTIDIDPRSGLLPYTGQEDPVGEVFLRGTEPEEAAPSPEDEAVDLYEEEPGAEPEDDGETRPAGADDPSDSEPRPPGSTAPTPPRTPAGPGDTPVVPPF